MKKKYLLSTGKTTYKVEEYIIDLVTLYLTIYPGDIPHRKDFGVDFNLSGVFKDELPTKLSMIISKLLDKIKNEVGEGKYEIKQESLDIIDEETAKLVISINGKNSNDIYIDLI